MSHLLTLFAGEGIASAPAPHRVAIANNMNIPHIAVSSANWVFNDWTTHFSGPAEYRDIELVFLNGYVAGDSENNGGFDFNLKASVLMNGVFYPAYDASNPSERVVFMDKQWGIGRLRVPGLVIPPNTFFQTPVQRVAADGGAAGTYLSIYNASGPTFRQDGSLAGTDPSKDFTLGEGVAWGAKAGAVSVNGSGQVTGVAIANGGQNYTSGINLVMWYGPAGTNKPGSLMPGSGVGGYGSPSGGKMASITIDPYPGGSGHSQANPPHAFVGGSGTVGSGFGGGGAAYGPSLILGTTQQNVPGVLLIGDSNTAATGSLDTGDINGAHGWLEQILSGRYGIQKMAIPGGSALVWPSGYSKRMAFLDAMLALGYTVDDTIIALGTNDFLASSNSGLLSFTLGKVEAIAAALRARGSRIHLVTLPPCATSTDGFVTTANQTVKMVGGTADNWGAGGRVQQYNASLLAGAIENEGIIDLAALCRDATSPEKWKVNAYSSGTAFTSDGTHFSIGTGIAWLVANPPAIALPAAPPVLLNDAATVNYNTPLSLNVLANDKALDYPLDAATLAVTIAPAYGTAAAGGGAILYTPAAGFSGSDSFTYIVSDTAGNAAYHPGTVSLSVSPFDMTNLLFWFDPSDASTLTESGGVISQMRDKSGNGRHANQATSGARPAYGSATIGGRNALAFDGGNDVLLINDFAYLNQTGLTVLAVAEFSAVVSEQTMISHYDAAGNNRSWALMKNASHYMAFLQSTNGASGAGNIDNIADNEGVLSVTTPYLLAARFAPYDTGLYVNGDTRGMGTASTIGSLHNSSVAITIGARLSTTPAITTPFNGKIGEILVFNEFLGSTRLAQVTGYLMQKWGIAA